MCEENLKIRALELYSGIGGMHYAFKQINEIKAVAAVDISPLANSVYRHNFPSTCLFEKGIEGMRYENLPSV